MQSRHDRRPRAEQALASAVQRIGDRWSLLVIAALLDAPRKFGELQESVPGVSTNVLAARLRELERHGLVVTEPYSDRPVRLEYHATARAAELAGALRLMAAWGAADAPGGPQDHEYCGTPLEVRYYCPTCQEIVDEEADVWV